MTPFFVQVTIDIDGKPGGTQVIDVLQIQRFGPAYGTATGCRIRFRDASVIDVLEPAGYITAALRRAGILNQPSARLGAFDPLPGYEE